MKATGISALKVDKILVALKATVDGNVNFHRWQDFDSSESYSQECQFPLLTGFGSSKSLIYNLSVSVILILYQNILAHLSKRIITKHVVHKTTELFTTLYLSVNFTRIMLWLVNKETYTPFPLVTISQMMPKANNE